MNSKSVTVLEGASILEAIRAIDGGGMQIAVVIDGEGLLKGVVTDGDVRRGLLRGLTPDAPLSEIINRKPMVIRPADSLEFSLRAARQQGLRQLPLVDNAGRFIGLKLSDQTPASILPNCALLMAGGLGVRLRPLTNTLPKPLIELAGKPILEIMLEKLVGQGLGKFFVSVNYKAEMIANHFGNGQKWGVDIRYLHETQRMGTAGALSLLSERPELPMLVMNGDILTSVNIAHMLDYHADLKAALTVGVFVHEQQIPYGVVEMNGNFISEIREKPIARNFISAGVYIISPHVLDLVEENSKLDMPELIATLIKREMRVAAFPIREYWIDIGHHDDLLRAQREIGEFFYRPSDSATPAKIRDGANDS
jgi:dTDP-glucose pyrophosphorylase